MTQEIKTINEVTPLTMLNMAIEQGADLDKLEKLMELQERWEAKEARKAFVVAMNKFKKNPPEIEKDKAVSFNSTSYKHASLSNVVDKIGAALAKQGLSHKWDVDQLDGGMIKVTCVITHEMGHSESVPLQSSPDQTGGKNSIQAVGSTVSYLQRYTLLAATGLTTKEMDDDGATVELITEEQVNELHARASEADVLDRFYTWLKGTLNITNMNDIKARDYTLVSNTLNGAIKLKEGDK